MTDEFQETYVQDIASLAIAGQVVRGVDDTPFLLAPPGYKTLDLSSMRNTPTRHAGQATLIDRGDFCQYVTEYRGEDTRVFGDGSKFVAFLRFPSAIHPSWTDWLAVFEPVKDDDWKRWRAHAGQWMSQVDLANFLEDNCEVVDSRGGHSGAEMLELAKGLSIRRTVDFSSKVNLTSGGMQFTYNEQDKGTTGTVVIPETFAVNLAVYRGEPPVLIRCRFQYRITEGKLSMRFGIPNADDVERREYEQMLLTIEAYIGKVYRGAFSQP